MKTEKTINDELNRLVALVEDCKAKNDSLGALRAFSGYEALAWALDYPEHKRLSTLLHERDA